MQCIQGGGGRRGAHPPSRSTPAQVYKLVLVNLILGIPHDGLALIQTGGAGMET